MRGVVAVASPVAFVLSFIVFSGIGYAILAIGGAIVGEALPSYLLEEGGILISALVWSVVGIWLLIDATLRGAALGKRGFSGKREGQPQPRVG
jgi:hypothetical protein